MVNSSFSGGIVSEGWLDDVMSFVDTPKYRIAQETDVEMWPTCHVDHVARQRETQQAIRDGALQTSQSSSAWAYDDQARPSRSAASRPCT